MSATDEALNEVIAKAGKQQLVAIMTALDKGIRDGLEFAAQTCDVAVKVYSEDALPTEVEEAQIEVARMLRDQIRLFALQLETPEVLR